jgi:pimeloyl-ACP methyl ester carboxylesterase
MAMSTPTFVQPFVVSIEQSTLDDLQTRLRLTRWPDKETVTDWSQGVPLTAIQELCEHWQTEYDWRRCEALLNSYPQFTTSIDGLEIYFLHIRSKHENALPLLLTHGWPGSILEFRHVIEKLVDPESHGGSAEDAFHLVIPALPGYAFSARPTEKGWNINRTALAWAKLMDRLGYADRGWVAQGGDWGAFVVASLGHQAPKGLRGVHFNSIFFEPKVSPTLAQLKEYILILHRKRYRVQPITLWVKNEPCISTVYEMPDTVGTRYSSRRDLRPLAMDLQTHQSHKLLGFTRNSETGLTTAAMWRQCLPKTRCSTSSCCTGCPTPAHLLLAFTGKASSALRHKRYTCRLE